MRRHDFVHTIVDRCLCCMTSVYEASYSLVKDKCAQRHAKLWIQQAAKIVMIYFVILYFK